MLRIHASLRVKLALLVLTPLLLMVLAVLSSIHLLEDTGNQQMARLLPAEIARHWQHLESSQVKELKTAMVHVWHNRELVRALREEPGLTPQQEATNSWNQIQSVVDAFYLWHADSHPPGVATFGMELTDWTRFRSPLIQAVERTRQNQWGMERFPDGQVRLALVQPLFLGPGRPMAYAVIGMDMKRLTQAFRQVTGLTEAEYHPLVASSGIRGEWMDGTGKLEITLPFADLEDHHLGGLLLLRDESRFHAGLHDARVHALTLSMLIGLVALLFGMVFVRWLMRRIAHLTSSMEQISNAYACPIDETRPMALRGDDLDQLEDYFNRMVCLVTSSRRREQEQHAQLEESHRLLAQSLQDVQRTQHQLIQAEKMAALGAMVAGVAHEINTPLGLGYTGITHHQDQMRSLVDRFRSSRLTRSELEQFLGEAPENIEIVRSNLQRAAELVHSFKQVAVDQTDISDRNFDLGLYLGELIPSLRPQFKRRNIQLVLDCPEGLMLYTCPGSLSQVVSNLVINALVHAFDEHSRGMIRIEARKVSAMVTLRVCDDGCGIPHEIQGRIFDPFFSTRRHDGGSGLGLHVVFNLVSQKLEGTITLESQPGRGSCFDIRFPQCVSRAPTPSLIATSSAAAAFTEQEESSHEQHFG
ncbi:MAG: HAMP domain-containing histidine kinase [Magnetococcus sp. WYHC-3]